MCLKGMARQKTKGPLPYTKGSPMNECDICKRKSGDSYRVDDHIVCETCLMQGRLDEIPDYAIIERHELDPVGAGATVSSWWNRDIPAHPGS